MNCCFLRDLGSLFWIVVALFLSAFGGGRPAVAQNAVEVLSYDQGATAAPVFGSDPLAFFNDTSAALGSPSTTTGTGAFAGGVTPFNAPYLLNQIVSVGEGGHITLRLSNMVVPQSNGPEIGVFTNASLIDDDYPNGLVENPATTFGEDSASVDVSSDGVQWVSLGSTLFDAPTSAYTDIGQTVLADFGLPFTAALSSFDGLSLSDSTGADVLGVFNGSGGGKWLDISATGLNEVGYVRFRVADDNDPSSSLNFELDALSIATSAIGNATVPEPSSGLLMFLAGLALLRRRRLR